MQCSTSVPVYSCPVLALELCKFYTNQLIEVKMIKDKTIFMHTYVCMYVCMYVCITLHQAMICEYKCMKICVNKVFTKRCGGLRLLPDIKKLIDFFTKLLT